jgi:hypothetical protein
VLHRATFWAATLGKSASPALAPRAFQGPTSKKGRGRARVGGLCPVLFLDQDQEEMQEPPGFGGGLIEIHSAAVARST